MALEKFLHLWDQLPLSFKTACFKINDFDTLNMNMKVLFVVNNYFFKIF